MRRISVITLSCLTGAGLLLVGCKKSPTEAPAAEQKKPQDPAIVSAHADLMKQLKVGPPKWASVAGSLKINARVEADETRIARVNSPVSGRLTDLDVVEGQTVRRGQVLATLHSVGLSDAQFAFVKAASQQQLAQRAADRAKLLVEADVIGSAELQRRQAELLQATAELSSSRDQLRLLGMPEGSIEKLESTRTLNSISQVTASISGTILERKVTSGQVVQPAESMFVIADLSSVWLVADVPEQNAGTVAVGKAVQAEIPALPGVALHGKVSFVSDIVNPETRTVRVRMDVPNPGRRFKPAMLATMTISDSAAKQRVVPATAIVREENRDHVFVRQGKTTFALRAVELGDELEDAHVLVSGVAPEEEIVLDGAFHLNNERQRKALQGAQ